MRLLSILTALAVVLALFFLVFQRDALMEFAGIASPEEETPTETAAAEQTSAEAMETSETSVSVVALKSQARTVDGAVILRGRTEAIRQVEVRAETSGRVISTPLRRGEMIAEGEPQQVVQDKAVIDASLGEEANHVTS